MKQIITLLMLSLWIVSHGQESTVIRYYKERYTSKTVKENKANYKLVIKEFEENERTEEFYKTDGNILLWNRIYKDDLPVGVWKNYSENGILRRERNFDDLIYSSKKDPAVPDVEKIDKAPEFIGGEPKMMEFIQKNIEYPSEAVEEGYQGIVYVRLRIDSDGSISEISIARDVHPFLDYESYRVVKAMKGKWSPAKDSEGNPIDCYYVLPIHFRLG